MRPVIPPSQPTCNPKPNGHYQDAHLDAVVAASKAFCRRSGNKVVRTESVRIGFEEVPRRHPLGNDAADDNYDFKINSVDGCPAPAGYNLAEPVKGVTCEKIKDTAWTNCNNQGRGGTITVGCLVYGIYLRF